MSTTRRTASDKGLFPKLVLIKRHLGIFPIVILIILTAFICQCRNNVIDEFRNNLAVVLVSDPMILKDGSDYYLYATSIAAKDRGFEVWHSTDMVNWRYKGLCFEKNVATWSQHAFWAPECVKAGDTYYLYFSAALEAGEYTSTKKVCVAAAKSPLGPFIELSAPLFEDECSTIDAHLFEDSDGRKYLYYAREVRAPNGVGLPLVENQIFMRSMRDYDVAEDDPTFCTKATQPWELKSFGGLVRWNEAPWVLKKGGIYYLMYSANCFALSDYSVGYATANSPYGPWTKYAGNPILKKTTDVSGPGHNCIVTTSDNEMWIGYHSHTGDGGEQRQLNLDRIQWNGDELFVHGPTTALQKYPAGGFALSGSSDNFNSPVLDAKWLIASEEPSDWNLDSENGSLAVTGSQGNTTGSAHNYQNIFLQHAPRGDFMISTTVTMKTTAYHDQANLYVWQNDDNYLRMAIGRLDLFGSKIGWTCELAGAYTSSLVNKRLGDTITLAIRKCGNTYQCLYYDHGWVQVGPEISAEFAPIKVGISAMSCPWGNHVKAYFHDFVLTPTGNFAGRHG